MMLMTDFSNWTITLPFSVPPGDTEGVLTEALFEAALEHAPVEAEGMTARADTREGKVWIVFTLVGASSELAKSVAEEMRGRVGNAVLSGDDACITAA
jgi:hypothetical protein